MTLFISMLINFNINFCFRFGTIQLTVVCKKFIKKGDELTVLDGPLFKIYIEDLNILKNINKNFSIFYNGKKKCSEFWLGPGSFINNSCKSNTEFIENRKLKMIYLKGIQDIYPNEEITTNYGKLYFAEGECQCKIHEKEKCRKNFFDIFGD